MDLKGSRDFALASIYSFCLFYPQSITDFLRRSEAALYDWCLNISLAFLGFLLCDSKFPQEI